MAATAVHKSCSDSTRPVPHNIDVKLRVQAACNPPPYKHSHSQHIILSWCACWATRCIFPRRSIGSNPDSIRGWCFAQGYAHRWGATHPGRWREHGCHIADDTKSCSSFLLLCLPCLLTATGWHSYGRGVFYMSDLRSQTLILTHNGNTDIL